MSLLKHFVVGYFLWATKTNNSGFLISLDALGDGSIHCKVSACTVRHGTGKRLQPCPGRDSKLLLSSRKQDVPSVALPVGSRVPNFMSMAHFLAYNLMLDFLATRR